MSPIALLEAGLPQTFKFKKKNAVSAKQDKMRFACI